MSKEKESIQIDNFNSTANLTSNPGFQSSLSIASKTPADDKPYNPFEHRDLAHPNSTIGSVVHLLKACLGTGLLAMPAAFKNSGLIVGIIGTLVSGLVCTHTVAMVVRTAQKLCVDLKKPALSFSETCGAAMTMGPEKLHKWSNAVRVAVDWSLSITYFSVLCVYVVFIGSSLKEVLDYYYPEALSIQGYCALTLVPLVLLCQIRNLKYLVPFSLIANVLVFVVFAITLYYLFVDLKPIGDREMVANVKSWPLFVSTAIFAMEGIGVVMPVENEMRNPKRFLGCPGVLNTAMGVTISLYCIVGFFGYVEYGDTLKGSVTLNLPEDELLAQTAKLLMALVIFLSYALQFYVPMEMITRMRKGKESKYENLGQVMIRTVIVTITVCIAATFPNLEMVISFVGAVFFSTLGLLLPAMVDILYRWHSGFGPCNYVLWKDIIIAIVAIVALFSGAYVSVLGIIEDFGVSSHDVHDIVDSHNATLT